MITKTVEIAGRAITIREIRPRDLVEVWEKISSGQIEPRQEIDALLRKCAPDLTAESFLDFYPSELWALWSAFHEVNQSFFDLARNLGLSDIVNTIVIEAVTNWKKQWIGSSDEATVPEPGTIQ